MKSPSHGFSTSSPNLHQHQVPSRHVGSYTLGVQPQHRVSSPLGFGHLPQGGQMPLAQSRAYDNSGQMRYSEAQMYSPGRSFQIASPPTGPPSGGIHAQYRQFSEAQGVQQSGFNNQDQHLYKQQYQQQQLQQQQSEANLVQQQAQTVSQQQNYQQSQQMASTQQNPQVQNNSIAHPSADISNQTVKFENLNLRNNNVKSQLHQQVDQLDKGRYIIDPNERNYLEEEMEQINPRSRGNRRGVPSPIYDYDEIESDSRVRKPLDAEQEKKLQKLKNEKTKRELHVQEQEYRIHVMEQENRSLQNQMEQMRNDYKRLNQVFEERYSHEIDRLQLENKDYENSNKQWSNRFIDIDQKCDDLNLDEENRRLGEKILKIQVLLHEQPIKNQARFESSSNKYN